jgi:hypothetical protein
MVVKVSVICITKRVDNKLEWALECLNRQTFSHNEFEYIIVDGLWKTRPGKYLEIAKNIGADFRIMHIPDKPTRWKGIRPAIANARNTGLIFANGTWVIHHDDCCKFGTDWIEKHVKMLEEGYFCAGSWIGCRGIDENGCCIPGDLGHEYRATVVKEPTVMNPGWFYCQNSSYPLEWALDVNGFDEWYDGEIGQEDISMGIRMERNGHPMMFDPTNNTEVYVASHYYSWTLVDPVNMVLKDGLEHFSNEWLTEKLIGDTDRIVPYGNKCIDIRTARSIMRDLNLSIDEMYKLMEKWTDSDKFDWRDGKLINDKLNKEEKERKAIKYD